jgi:hypothetical protein
MAVVPTWAFVAANGKPHLVNKDRFAAYFACAFGEGDVGELVARKIRKRRSYDQLKYWFGVPMTILSEKTGYTKMQMHYLCLACCFGIVADKVTGREVPVVPASKHLTTKQFSDLIEWCPPWAFETYDGLEIPLPEKVDLSSLPGVDDDQEAA